MNSKSCLLAVGLGLISATELFSQNTNSAAQLPGNSHFKAANIRPIGNWQVDPVETQELDQIFANSVTAARSVPQSADAGVQLHGVDNALRADLENFLAEHPNSAYGPGVHIWLGRQAMRLCGYTRGIDQVRAFDYVTQNDRLMVTI